MKFTDWLYPIGFGLAGGLIVLLCLIFIPRGHYVCYGNIIKRTALVPVMAGKVMTLIPTQQQECDGKEVFIPDKTQ